MAGEIDLTTGLVVEDASNSTMKTGVLKAPSGNSHVGDNKVVDTRHMLSRSPLEAPNESLHEDELECKTQEEGCSPSVHDDNFNLANDASEKGLERCNNNPDNETNGEEKLKESLKRSLSQPQISAFLKKDGNQGSTSKRVKLDVPNDAEVNSSRNGELSTVKETKKEVEVDNTEVVSEERDIVKERGADEEDNTDEDKVRKGDDDRKRHEDDKEIEETKEDENLQESDSKGEGGDAKEEFCEKEERVEGDRLAEECEGKKEEGTGQKGEDSGQKEEENQQKEDNDDKKSSKKSNEKQGLPSGWSRLSVPRKNGTQVDYYLVNQQGQKFRSQKEVDRWLQEQGQDLKVRLKPFSKEGQDIRRMFNGPKRTASGAETISSQQDMLKSQKDEENVAKREYPCIVESEEETPLSATVRPEKSDDEGIKVPALPQKRKRGRPRKTDSSQIKDSAKLQETTEKGEQPDQTPAELGTGRPHRVCRESKPTKEDEDEEVQRNNPAAEDRGKMQKSEKENIDPTTDDKLLKKAKKTKKEAKLEEADDDGGSEGSEDIDVVNESYLEEISKFMEATDLGLIPDPPTKGDGNCWYRAAAEQVIVHSIPQVPKEHLKLRKAISDHLKNLPKQVKEDTINVVFVGKPRGLSDLAHRQRKPGQWVDNMGVMVMATAHYLKRNIHLIGYDPPGRPTERGYSLTVIEGEGGEKYPPLTIFYHDSHYQTLRPTKPTRSSTC